MMKKKSILSKLLLLTLSLLLFSNVIADDFEDESPTVNQEVSTDDNTELGTEIDTDEENNTIIDNGDSDY